MSPNSLYLAEVIDVNGGVDASDGSRAAQVTRQGRNIYFFIGALIKSPQTIYNGYNVKWTLRWETDEILYFGDNKYVIKDVLAGWGRSKILNDE
jgi:hypothetical protein